MPKWTLEQNLAIEKDNTNIIVSAGAGSGKTAVLTSRVIRKLKTGIRINELLILTFTKKAAMEMKERIRKNILKDETLKEQLEYIDSSYVTTFDSFALSIVKKYHYLLNISKNVSIADASILYIEKLKILDEVFDNLYEEEDEEFLTLLDKFTIKDDKEIKKMILAINDKLDLKYDKNEYLNLYLEKYYSEEFINKSVMEFENLLKEKINDIKLALENLELYTDSEYMEKMYDVFNHLLYAKNYDEILQSINFRSPNLPKDSDENAKTIKEEISKMMTNLKEFLRFSSSEELVNNYKSTSIFFNAIKKIINRFNLKINEYKLKNNLFDFTDISKMAIRILKENDFVKDELKYFFKEIMIDEYQDTSDLQEEFIKMIENNDVYMVGDIKQSIYRFRNANPYLFKSKYDNYGKNLGGFKIDLTKNFRSRSEVVSSVNLLFESLMHDDLGGANYEKEHKMIFGNTSYDEIGKKDEDSTMEIINYKYDKEKGFSKEECEIFYIAQDIKKKIEEKYKIFDKDEGIIRECNYSDFSILLDKSANFDLYKKIFEYFSIPLTKYMSTNITSEIEIVLIKNILKLIISLKDNVFDLEYRYSFVSIARSNLFSYSDNEIFEIIKNNSYKDTDIFKKVKKISDNLDSKSLNEIIYDIVYDFDFYFKQILVGDVDSRASRIDEIINIFKNLSVSAYSIYDAYNFLDTIINEEVKLEIKDVESFSNSVKIMTIHASKGLEFPVCYFASLHSKFNIRELNEKFLYSDKYGIVCPYFNEGIGKTYIKDLVKDNYIREEISEKIRLFYVALTRPKEKIIMVTSFTDERKKLIHSRSFLDMLETIKEKLNPFIIDIDMDSLNLTKNYDVIKEYNYKDSIENVSDRVDVLEFKKEKKEITKKRASKETIKLLSKTDKEKMKLGVKIHEVFEHLDFFNPDLDNLDINEFFKDKIQNFLDILNFSSLKKVYKEYEFLYSSEEKEKHGIIDLMLEYEEEIKIIDYKLKDVEDTDYIKQLNDYKDYIKTKTKKDVSIYLYSVIDSMFKKL